MEIKNNNASVKIALQGAHIYEYKRKGEEDLLWLSDISDFEEGKAIRGGIPICWPSFGMNNASLPQHGFARTSMFEHIYTKEIDVGTTQVLLRLADNASTRKLWNHKFELDVMFTISSTLKIELKTTNLDTKDFTITQALHSYFSISDIRNIKIKGLENKLYFDALQEKNFLQKGIIEINEEFDNVYQEANEEIVLEDNSKKVHLKSLGSSSVVVWNPWVEKTKRMSAMKEDDYKNFVCIETANAFEDFKLIKPKESHTLSVEIR